MCAYTISMDQGSLQNEQPVAMGRAAPASCPSSNNGPCNPFQGRSFPSLQCLPATVPQAMINRQTENTKDRRNNR